MELAAPPTATASLLSTSKDVEFQDIYYTVTERKHFIRVSGSRQILRGVSGSFRNGQLSAIMGPSGAGKSSLLNAISGYQTVGVEGHIKIKRKDSCYITQEDNHQTLLSVEELMNFACNLKLKNCQRQDQLITEILENLMLNHCRHVTANRMSGGERKRLSIALEMVANPNIFFLDEPTSGLDEVTASQCVALLGSLAKQGRTIVCTIHQPSATIFNYFDHIFVLARGVCVYQGGPNALLPFLKHVQLECPKYYSPSDYIIELCDSDEGKLIPLFSNITDNGKLMYAPLTAIGSNGAATSTSQAAAVSEATGAWDFCQAVTTLFVEQPQRSRLYNIFSTASRGSLIGSATALYEQMKAFSKRIHQTERQRQTSALQQFFTLLAMMLLRISRARIALVIQFAHHILCGLFFGLIFLKSGNEGERMFDHLKFCIGTVLMIVYTQVMVPILSFPSEVKLVKKETFNRWYTLTPYYAALNLSRVPLQIVLNLTFLSITYWMSGLPNQLWRFALFAAVGQMTSFVAEGMGLAIGATFNITNGSAVGPLIIAPFMGLAVYGFDFAAQIPYGMDLLMKFSYIRVSVVALVLTIFGFEREELACNAMYCHFSDPKVLLKFVGIDKVSLYQQFLLLAGLMIFFRLLLYISLRKRCRA